MIPTALHTAHPTAPWPLSTEDQAPWSAADYAATHATATPEVYTSGISGTLRQIGYGDNSWLSGLIVVMLIALALNFNNYRRLAKSFGSDLVGLRRRSNAFDEHTSNEARSYVIIILTLCICEGILIFTSGLAPAATGTSLDIFLRALTFMGFAGAFYLLQFAAYRTVGYAFTDSTNARQWIRGFNASQALLALLLLGPALISLYYPTMSHPMFVIGCAAYVFAKIFFIFKGFKIFYDNILSIVYFILYLCTLEITPVVFLQRAVEFI